jgi:hypothetical protein
MRLAGLWIVVALAPAWAQIQLKQAPGTVAAKPAVRTLPGSAQPVSLQTLADIEKDLNKAITAAGGAEPCVVVGLNRGLYLRGFGTIFTSEVDLINSPATSPFMPTILPQQKEETHKHKVAHVPMLEQGMRDAVRTLAARLYDKDLVDTDQIVMAVRLVYRPWEDTSGLPGQIVMRMDRKGGEVKMEMQ